MNTKRIISTSTEPRVAWHSLDPEKVLERLSATRNGLDPQEVQARLLRYGEDVIAVGKNLSVIQKFFLGSVTKKVVRAARTDVLVSDSR